MEGMSDFIEINDLLKDKVLGITIRELGKSPGYDPITSLNCLKLEASASKFDKKSVIKNINYDSKNDECYISAIIDVPLQIKELVDENGSPKIIGKSINFPRDISALIRLNKGIAIFFSKGRREVQKFSKHLKQITLGGLRPIPLEFDQSNIKYFLKSFKSINHLKIQDKNNQLVTTYKGPDLPLKKQILDQLNIPDISIYEIGGEFEIVSGEFYDLYINFKGRALLKGENKTIDPHDFNKFLKMIEDMRGKL